MATIILTKGGDNGVSMIGGANPGDTIVIQASQNPWSYIFLGNLTGTASQPITVVNSGAVQMTAGITLQSPVNVNLHGNGAGNGVNGITINRQFAADQNAPCIHVKGLPQNLTVSYISTINAGYSFWIKNEIQDTPDNDPCNFSWMWPQRMVNIRFHHITGSNLSQDGAYVFPSDPYGKTRSVVCGGTTYFPRPTGGNGIVLHDITFSNVGRSGIQWGGTDLGTNKIYNCNLTQCGLELNDQQGCGIAIGSASRNVEVYGNFIDYTYKNGIFSYGYGLNFFHHNTINHSGQTSAGNLGDMAALFINTFDIENPETTRFWIDSNTLGVNSDANGKAIVLGKTNNTYGTGNRIFGNTYQGAPLTNSHVGAAAGITWATTGGKKKGLLIAG